MRTRLLQPIASRAADWAPALLISALGWWELSSGDGFYGDTLPNAVAVGAMGASLLFRRSRPGVAAAGIAVTLALQALLLGTPESAGEFLAILLVLFSVAAHAEGAQRRFGAAVLAVAHVIATARDGTVESFDEALPGTAIALAAWFVGAAVGRRTEQALRADAARVAAEERREADAREAVAHERARIAREIHDVIAHGLGAIVVQAGAGRLDAQDAATAERLHAIERSGRQSLLELRRLLGILRRVDEEAPLAPRSGIDDIEALAETARAAGVDVQVSINGVAGDLPPGVEMSAYRIVQEALTNVVRHARAVTCQVRVTRENGTVRVEVVDDGRGATAEGSTDGGGFGLLGMRERVQIYGGSFEAGPRSDGGFSVCAELPVEAEAA